MSRVLVILFALVLLSSCGLVRNHSRYGYEEKKLSQERYLKELGHEHFFTHDDNWEQKLEVKKKYFNDMLKREYLKFSDDLSKNNNHTDSTYFRRKGLDAARADFNVLPENPSKWNVKDDEELEDLKKARLALIDSLVGFMPVIEPVRSAKAIVEYDCWLQQSQKLRSQHSDLSCRNNFQNDFEFITKISRDVREDDIEVANNKFKGRGSDLENPANRGTKFTRLFSLPPRVAVEEKEELTPNFAKKPAPVKPTITAKVGGSKSPLAKGDEKKSLIVDQSDTTPDLVYIAYFDKKIDILTDVAKLELDKTVDQIKKNNPKSVSVNGHTDRSYDSSSSLLTSKKRADLVRDYLISKGIAKEIIRTYGFGKTDNLVDNNEGEEKPANNRVEVVFKGTAS